MGHAWDVALFRAVHLGLHRDWLDPVMSAFSSPGALKIPLLVLLGGAFLLRGRRGRLGVLVLALTLACSDQLASKVVKPIVKRTRPSVEVVDSKPLFGVRHSRSFPSAHAANFFAAAPIVGYVFPQIRIVAYALAGVVCFSRVYVGDHWPSDVIAGALLGLVLGWVWLHALRRLEQTVSGARGRAGAAPSGARSDPDRADGSRTTPASTRYTRPPPRSGRAPGRPKSGKRRSRPEGRARGGRSDGAAAGT